MTQEVRAERAGLGVRTLPYLERDRRAAPRQDTLDLLVRALTLSPQE
jgi:transcriptional regulator with XRE-family HTH domain